MHERLSFLKGQQNKFLREFLNQNCISVSSAANFLRVGETTFKRWLNEENKLPENAFYEICQETPSLKIYEELIKRRLSNDWGRSKGGKSRIHGIKNLKVYLNNVRNIRNEMRLSEAASSKRSIKINDSILSKLLENNVDLKFVLATCLLTDGSLSKVGNSYRISYYTKDPTLRKFMKSLLCRLSSFIPSETLSNKGVYSIRVTDHDLSIELLRLSPSYKKNPANGQSGEDYMAEIQPSLRFMQKGNEQTIRWCIRFAFSTDGSISISKNKNAELNLACYNPKLASQWLTIFKNYNILGKIGKSKNSWSGISGVRVYDPISIKNFSELGGFVPYVKISSKSKRYKGLEKNTLLKKATWARSFLVQ